MNEQQVNTVQANTVNNLWQNYLAEHSDDSRETLILHYAPLIKYVAGRLAIGLPSNVEIDDLISNGIFGLIDAIERFEPERGIKFETYAIARIRGAIIDSLRENDWAPRSVRQKARELERVCSELENRLGRTARDSEISDALQISMTQFNQMISEISCATVSSLDELWQIGGADEDSVRLIDLVKDGSEDPSELVENEEIKSILAAAIDALPERERLIISLYHYEGLTLREIGATLDVSESRVSQIHTKAIMRLRSRLARLRPF